MICRNPYVKGVMPCGCGWCLPCKINKRKMWKNRILLESMCHDENAYITLTYDNENIPKDGSLEPSDAQKWVKRLRKKMGTKKIRYFLVGEYGDKDERPHYHAIVFGCPTCRNGRSEYDYKKPCEVCSWIKDTWDKGFIHVGSVEKASVDYVCGYTIKKMTAEKSEKQKEYLKGRRPEFVRMSLRPAGIGAEFVTKFGEQVKKEEGIINEVNDVGCVFKIGGKDVYIGKYLHAKFREAILGFKETPEASKRKFKEEMSRMLREAKEEREKKPHHKIMNKRDYFVDMNKQRMLNMEKKYKMFSGG